MPRPRSRPSTPKFLQAARELRSESTDAEAILWDALRDRKLGSLKFRRQHPIEPFMLDFYCPEKKLAVELDGSIHQEPIKAQLDAERTKKLEEKGIAVLRYRNDEVEQHLGEVLSKIEEAARRLK